MVVVHGQVHAAAGDAGLVREDGQRGLVLAVVPPVRARRCLYMWKSNFGRPTPSTRCCLRSCVCAMAWRFHAIDATLSPWRRLDGVEAHWLISNTADDDHRDGPVAEALALGREGHAPRLQDVAT